MDKFFQDLDDTKYLANRPQSILIVKDKDCEEKDFTVNTPEYPVEFTYIKKGLYTTQCPGNLCVINVALYEKYKHTDFLLTRITTLPTYVAGTNKL